MAMTIQDAWTEFQRELGMPEEYILPFKGTCWDANDGEVCPGCAMFAASYPQFFEMNPAGDTVLKET